MSRSDSHERWTNPLERAHWAASREAVARFRERGGALGAPHSVVHTLSLPSREAADLFLEVAELRGYRRQSASPCVAPRDQDGLTLSLGRDEVVELEHLHRVVMDLAELAAPYDGDHVGWSVPRLS